MIILNPLIQFDPSIPNAPGGDGTDIGRATLDAVLASIGRNNLNVAINQLQAFDNKVRAQVLPSDPALATVLLQEAQDAIAVMKLNLMLNKANRFPPYYSTIPSRPNRFTR